MLVLIVGLIAFAAGAALVLLALRGRLVEGARVRRERDLLEVRLESERANAEDRFQALSAEALRSNNEQFLTLARETLGGYQTEARGELEKREKAVAQLVAPIAEQLTRVDTRLERLDRDRVQTASMLQQQLRTMVESQDRLRGGPGRWWRRCESRRRAAAGARCSCETWSRWPAWSATATSPSRSPSRATTACCAPTWSSTCPAARRWWSTPRRRCRPS